MNALKLLAVGVVVCLFGPVVRAEEKVDYAKMMVGKWEVSKGEEGTVAEGTLIEFTKDGKVNVVMKQDGKEEKMAGTYKVDGNKFTATLKVGEDEHTQTITITKISETEMSTENKDGKKVTLTKKK